MMWFYSLLLARALAPKYRYNNRLAKQNWLLQQEDQQKHQQ